MRQLKISFLMLLIASPLIPSMASAEGRLFYTQSQREALEQVRLHRITESQVAQPRPIDSPVTFNGMVLRSDGRNTRWINDRPIAGTFTPPAYKGHALKPGQTAAYGKIYEPHQVIRENMP
jgi:hypothetical protein